MYGLNTQRSMQEKGMPVCLPEMSLETARLNILKFMAIIPLANHNQHLDIAA
jgi:hypothetical protein